MCVCGNLQFPFLQKILAWITGSVRDFIFIYGRGKGKGEIVSVLLFLTEYHAIKAYWGSIFYLGSSWS
jgi:hypothetical protein